ncbi:MAG: ATP-binding cassette domain-containing protein [Nitrososphaerales archaeon]
MDGLSFDVRPGEFFALLGPNGAGKTTTISILTTTLAKTSGTVIIAGHDLDAQEKEVRQNIGIIFQNPSLDMNLTAEENIRFHVSLYGVYGYRPNYHTMPKSYRERILELSDVLGIAGEIFKPVKTFSGGMKRKLEIIRSLIHDPKILFLDEPTQGLDAVSRASLWEYLQKIHRERKMTIFLTTHYIVEAEIADRVCIVNHGKRLFFGSPEEMKGPMIGKYLLLDADDRDSLKHELTSFGPEVVEDGRLKISFSESTPQKILSQIKTPLSFMRLHEPTLEEAYIGLVSNGQGNEEAL